MLNEAEKEKKEGDEGAENELADSPDLDRDDDSAEFAFEDAMDQPYEGEDFDAEEAPKAEQFNFDQIIEKIENPQNVKKSFELRCQNDDDDDIFIVHDGEGEGDGEKDDQEDLFLEPPSMSFNIIDENKKDVEEAEKNQDVVSPTGEFEKIEFNPKDFQDSIGPNAEKSGEFNPFIDNLANSEAVPQTQKLEQVLIQDNYVGEVGKNDKGALTQKLEAHAKRSPSDMLSQSASLPASSSEATDPLKLEDAAAKKSSTMHQENLKKRRQKKGQNLSIHQFDEAT